MINRTWWMWVVLVAMATFCAGCQQQMAEPVAGGPEQEPRSEMAEEPLATEPEEMAEAARETAPVTSEPPQPVAAAPPPPVDRGVQDVQASPAPVRTPQPRESYAEAQPTRSERIYVVRKGDTLQKISQRFYGTTRNWRRIYEANRSTLTKGPDMIQVGMRLVIP